MPSPLLKFDYARGGFSSENTQPVIGFLGRPPLTIKQYVADHKAAFA
jgi:hypothetical protein